MIVIVNLYNNDPQLASFKSGWGVIVYPNSD